MNDREALVQVIGNRLAASDRILLLSHVRPDGDAIGSLLGLGLSLQTAGKDVFMVLEDGLPSNFNHLLGHEQILRHAPDAYDCICVVDCSDFERTGDVINPTRTPDINIDHHRTNLNFASMNLVETEAVATAEILARLLKAINLPINKAVAENLLTGIVTDTIGFRTSNMTPAVLRLTADLMELGVNLPELYQRALINRSFEAAKYWGAGLTKLERDGRLAWATLTLADRQEVNYSGRDDADLSNVLSAINDIDISIIFVEQSDDHVKVSWRAQPGYDVSLVALSFGGGGHPAASGADIKGNLLNVQQCILGETRLLMNGRKKDGK